MIIFKCMNTTCIGIGGIIPNAHTKSWSQSKKPTPKSKLPAGVKCEHMGQPENTIPLPTNHFRKEKMIHYRTLCTILILTMQSSFSATTNGPLRISENPNFFEDASGVKTLLTGSHTWETLQDITTQTDTEPFAWNDYLGMMELNGHNFLRLWVWEQCQRAAWTEEAVYFSPMPYLRTGETQALDGKPTFDLDHWNEDYFQRLRKRVIDAKERGIYVSIMLFQGWSLNKTDSENGDPYLGHPFNPENNVQGFAAPGIQHKEEGDATLHSLKAGQELTRRQEAYVTKVINTVNDLDNVLFEIINEGGTIDWTAHMIRFIHEYEKQLPYQHMVGMTARITPLVLNEVLYQSEADWVSPANEPLDWIFPGTRRIQDFEENPPENHSGKVVVLDTDHLWGHGGNYLWAWKSFCRGYNPIFMDPWQPLAGTLNPDKVPWMYLKGGICKDDRNFPDWAPLRSTMGVIRKYSERIDLANARPRSTLSSTGYCLTDSNSFYLVFFENNQSATLNLTGTEGEFDVEWYIPILDRTIHGSETIKAGGYIAAEPPFTGAAVLLMKRHQD